MEDNKEADNSPQTETTITKSSPGIGRLILRLFLLVVIPIIAVVFGAQWYEKTGRYVETENAYVKTNVIAISADIDGRVTEVFVDENQVMRFKLITLPKNTAKMPVLEVPAPNLSFTSLSCNT